MLENILLAFIPLFVTVDPIGILPIFVAWTKDVSKKDKKNIIIQSLLTALTLAVGFIFLGKLIFQFLGITMGDFMVAGGAILFCVAIMDLLQPGKARPVPAQELGAVPIGTPLIVGPAVLTTALMMVDQHGLAATLATMVLNIVVVGIVFLSSQRIIKVVGQSGTRALSKVMALLLAAIAVMMIRKGIVNLLHL